jgi:hypothetical protein
MADNSATLKFGAEIGELKSGISQAQAAVQSGMTQIQSSIGSMATHVSNQFSQVQTSMRTSFNGMTSIISQFNGVFSGLVAIVGGGKLFENMISSTTAWTGEVVKLSKAMGITTQEASVLSVGLRLIGKSSDDFTSASMKLLRAIKANEDGVRSFGLETRDKATGALKPMTDLMQDAISVMMQYKEGADRDTVALNLFGRSASEVMELQKLNAEVMERARQVAERLHLIVGPQGAAQVRAYKMTVAELDLAFESMKIRVGTGLIPELTKFSSWMSSIAPGAITIFSTALKAVAMLLDAVGSSIMYVYHLFEIFWNMLNNVTTGMMKFISSMAHLDWEGMKTAADDTIKGIQTSWNTGLIRMQRDTENFINRTKNLFRDLVTNKGSMDAGISIGGGIQQKGTRTIAAKESPPEEPPKTKTGSAAVDKSRVQIWRQELEEMKDAEDSWIEFSKARELEYWQDKLAWCKAGSSEYRQVYHVVSQLKKDIAKQENEDLKQSSREALEIQKEGIDRRKDIALGAIEIQAEEIRSRRALGLISAKEEIQSLIALENQKYQIELQALQDRLALIDMESKEYQKILGQIEKLEQKHALDTKKLQNQIRIESKNTWDQIFGSIKSAFDKSITGIIMGTTTLKDAIKNIFQSILGEFVNLGVKMVVDWVARHAIMLAESMGWSVAEESTKTAAVAADAGIQIAANSATITRDAGVTFAGVYANLAPFLGPMAAIPAAVSMAEVMTMLGTQIPAAAGGMEVDRDQLIKVHEKEVVLPAAWTERLKTITEGKLGQTSTPDDSRGKDSVGTESAPYMVSRSKIFNMLQETMQSGIRHKKDVDLPGVLNDRFKSVTETISGRMNEGRETRVNEGRETKDEGRETRDEGRETKDEGRGIMDTPSSVVRRPSSVVRRPSSVVDRSSSIFESVRETVQTGIRENITGAISGASFSLSNSLGGISASGGYHVPGSRLSMLNPKEGGLSSPPGILEKLTERSGTGDRTQQDRTGSRGDRPVAPTLQMHISAVDAKSFEQALSRSGSKLNQLIKKSYRDFNLRGSA